MFSLEPNFGDFEQLSLNETLGEDYKAEHKIPRLTGSDTEMLEKAKSLMVSAEDFLTAFFGANIALSFVSAGLLQYLWGLVNTMQIIVLTALFKLDMPENAEMVFVMALKLCALDMFSTEKYIDKLFPMRDTPPF